MDKRLVLGETVILCNASKAWSVEIALLPFLIIARIVGCKADKATARDDSMAGFPIVSRLRCRIGGKGRIWNRREIQRASEELLHTFRAGLTSLSTGTYKTEVALIQLGSISYHISVCRTVLHWLISTIHASIGKFSLALQPSAFESRETMLRSLGESGRDWSMNSNFKRSKLKTRPTDEMKGEKP